MYETVLILYNPNCHIDKRKLEHELRFSFSRHKITPIIMKTDREGRYDDVFFNNFSLVIIAGGDGTVNGVVSACIQQHASPTLALIPCGSANLLASFLGVPKSVHKAVDFAMSEKPSEHDVFMINKKYVCIVAMGIGYDAFVMRMAREHHKRMFGLWVYFFHLLSGIFHWRETNYSLLIDGKRLQRHAKSLFLMNIGIFFGFTFGPNVHYNDGKIDVAVVRPVKFFDIVKLFLGIVSQKYFIKGRLEYHSGKRVQVNYDAKVPVHIDGETIDIGSPIEITILPKRIKIIGSR